MLDLALKILLAHLLGDFVLQSSRMAAAIENRVLKSPMLYLHTGIHLFLLLLFTQFSKNLILPCILLAASHFLIDAFTKTVLKKRLSPIAVFSFDQLLHFGALALFVAYHQTYEIDWERIFGTKTLLAANAVLVTTFCSAVVMKKLMQFFPYEAPKTGLAEAGFYIGILERLLIFIFITCNLWEGVGFLLAAKSIFRFGDLRENKEIKLTEYILIGTLLSFTLAIVTALIYLKIRVTLN
ncbi:DUF3307 domain-containing protein [Flavobacterium sp.]|uniref:DUF3307 domain-containing protein n=1 Tax=Flavobacterium sp. TaxID=239 RepID=UPI00261ACAB0|nr:DUF3307 domain-containing protein [Flavobacterium sp.]